MSGGSFDYLFVRDANEICSHEDDLLDMATRLHDLGQTDAAAATMAVLREVREARESIQAMLNRLSPVWKAIEYRDSGDWGEEPLQQALDAFNTSASLRETGKENA